MKPVTLHRAARAELDDAVGWYNDKQPGVGHELLDEVLAALDKIERSPGIGAKYRSTDRRFYRLKRFPYLIYYQEFSDHIWIAAIAHQRRRPGYWRKRKPD